MAQATGGRRLFLSGPRYHARMCRPRSLPLLSLLLLAACSALLGCGGDATSDRDQVNPVYERVMRALHAADWDALQRELTKEARFSLKQDMERFSRRLGHPQDGKREREIARVRLGAGADEAIRRASEGGVAEALAFFMRTSPRAEIPPRKSFKLSKFRAQFTYALADGTQHVVAFVRRTDGWYVSELQL